MKNDALKAILYFSGWTKIGQVLYIFYLHPSLRILGPNQKYSWYNHFKRKYWK